VLDHNRDIRFNDAGIVGIMGDRFRIGEVVEPLMLGASRRHGETIGPNGFAIGIINPTAANQSQALRWRTTSAADDERDSAEGFHHSCRDPLFKAARSFAV
jgi:hypothetical protein